MPSAPETSGNNQVVDNNTRPPSNLKIPPVQPAKYTDVTRTSSASFKPPMSKDPVLKKKTDTPHTDSTWFTPISYIKNMFGGKPSDPTTAQVSKTEKNKKSPPVKNTSNVVSAKAHELLENQEKPVSIAELTPVPTVLSENHLPSTLKQEYSPRFSYTASEASGRKPVGEKRVATKVEEENDPNAPKYNALRFVENKSTYLHTPEKKGTTSFRITTSSKVKTKPCSSSPKLSKRAKTTTRQSSASPKKIPHADSGAYATFPTRLRSKSTPDHSSVKQRLVSVANCPKSVNLKSNTNKHLQPVQNDVNENKAGFTDVKPPFKQSVPMKPTLLEGSRRFPSFSIKRNASQSSKSSQQIGITPSPHVKSVSRSLSAQAQNTQVDDSNRIENSLVKSPKSPPNINKAYGTKHSPLSKNTRTKKPPTNPQSPLTTRNQPKDHDPLAKFANSQQKAKDKLKARMEVKEENKLKAQTMVLPAAVENISCLSSKSGLVANNESMSPTSKNLLRKRKGCSVREMSPTIAESPVRRPSPPGVMCLTKLGPKEIRSIAVEEIDVQPYRETTRHSVDIETDNNAVAIPTTVSKRGSRADTFHFAERSASDCSQECMEPRDAVPNNADSTLYGIHSVGDQPTVEEYNQHISTEYCDMSNSACCYDDDQRLHGPYDMDLCDFQLDVFSGDVELDTCNSALSRKSIMSQGTSFRPSFESEAGESELCGSCPGPTVLFESNDDANDMLPFQKDVKKESIKFFADENPAFNTSLTSDSNPGLEAPPSHAIAVSSSPKKSGSNIWGANRRQSSRPRISNQDTPDPSPTLLQGKSPQSLFITKDPNKGTRRRFPIDVDRTKVAAAAQMVNDSGPKVRTPINKKVGPTEPTTSSGARLHPSPYASPTKTPTKMKGYLGSLARSAEPAVGGNNVPQVNSSEVSDTNPSKEKQNNSESSEEKEKENNTSVGVRSISPQRSRYKRTAPDISLGGIASTVGDALNSIADSLMKRLPTPQLKPEQKPLQEPVVKPTVILDTPMSSTATYIQSSLEEKGLSPAKWKVAKTQEKQVEKKESPVVVNEIPLKYRVIPPSFESDYEPPPLESPKTKKAHKKAKSNDVKYVVPHRKGTESPTKEISEPEPIKTEEAPKPKISLAPVKETLIQGFEDTKNYFSNVLFSPPVKNNNLPDLPPMEIPPLDAFQPKEVSSAKDVKEGHKIEKIKKSNSPTLAMAKSTVEKNQQQPKKTTEKVQTHLKKNGEKDPQQSKKSTEKNQSQPKKNSEKDKQQPKKNSEKNPPQPKKNIEKDQQQSKKNGEKDLSLKQKKISPAQSAPELANLSESSKKTSQPCLKITAQAVQSDQQKAEPQRTKKPTQRPASPEAAIAPSPTVIEIASSKKKTTGEKKKAAVTKEVAGTKEVVETNKVVGKDTEIEKPSSKPSKNISNRIVSHFTELGEMP